MQELYVDTPEQLQLLCEQIRGSEWLALDTEFMREKSYHPQLCLLQLSNGELAACIDPLRLNDLSPLLDILFDPAITKVFHASFQDLEIFQLLWQRLPTPLFDSQPAASLLGLGDQIGYGNLVKQLLDVELEKGHSRTDWARRPLDPAQQRYALDDVIYLGQIYLKLRQQLQQKGRLGWLDNEFARLADPASYRVDPAQAWQRVKGRQRLKGVQLAVLQALASWREEQALASDRPRRWIIKDEPLLDMARRQPIELAQLQQIRGLEAGTLKRHGDHLLKRITAAQRLPKQQWPRLKRPPAQLSGNQEALTDLLMCALRLLAGQQQIAPAAVAGRKELEQLVAGERELDLLRGWRGTLAGRPLLQILAGERWPQLVDGVLRLSDAPSEPQQQQ